MRLRPQACRTLTATESSGLGPTTVSGGGAQRPPGEGLLRPRVFAARALTPDPALVASRQLLSHEW